MNAPIVVFDGECALCNGFVAWLVRHDRDAVFLIAGSAGDAGRAVISAAGLPRTIGASTIVVWDGEAARIKSDAVAHIAARLPWPWRAAGAMRWVPRRVRDGVYDQAAKRRPRMHADDPACGVPPPGLVREWKTRLATPKDVNQPGS